MVVYQYITVPIYSCLFIVGVSGNIWVIRMIVEIKSQVSRRRQDDTAKAILVYVLSLCIVDSLILLCIPFILSDILLHYWPFGNVMCKIYMTLESTNKFLSTFILTAVAVDRFLTVCHSRPAQMHSLSLRSPFVVLSLCVGLALLCLAPLQVAAAIYLYQLSIFQFSITAFISATEKEVSTHNGTRNITKCFIDLPQAWRNAFICEAFAIGYCIPAIVITVCYSKVLSFTVQHDRNSTVRSRVPLKRVTVSSMLVVMFYYACWTPYWGYNVSFLIFDRNDHKFMRRDNPFMLVASFTVHILPWANSALNWVWYALLNRTLRMQYCAAKQSARGTHSNGTVTNTVTAAPTTAGSTTLLEKVCKQKSLDLPTYHAVATTTASTDGSAIIIRNPGATETTALTKHESLDLCDNHRTNGNTICTTDIDL